MKSNHQRFRRSRHDDMRTTDDNFAMVEQRLRSNFSVYFVAFLAMTFCQAVGMILVGVFSNSLQNESLFGPMELFMLSHLWIRHYGKRGGGGGGGGRREDDEEDDLHRATAADDDDVRELEAMLVNQTAQRLQQLDQGDEIDYNNTAIHDFLQAMMNDTNALDDYYQRRHMTRTTTNDDDNLPILIVGGSDGSGTRAFVDLLQSLGVPMLIDDKGTKDIHAPLIFSNSHYGSSGWPPLVQLILNQTHSANYELDQLEESTMDSIRYEMKRFQLSYAPKTKEFFRQVEAARKDQHRQLENQTTSTTAKQQQQVPFANHVQYGFKAPVTMLLLPLLLQTFGRIKFLHVVRDGRDVAFSANDSPVKKFYSHFYPDHETRTSHMMTSNSREIQAMQLWNDWNRQALDWQRQHVDNENFDFLVMRTEDLLSPETKLESLMRLADFVGSTLSTEELCCMSRRGIVDMGQSVAGGGKRRRRRHRDPFDGRPPGADPDEVLDLDDPSGISMERIALESERKTLDMALQKRPQVYQRIQQARKDNFIMHQAKRDAKLRNREPVMDIKHVSGLGSITARWQQFTKKAKEPPRRRLAEEPNSRKHEHNKHGHHKAKKNVLQRYGKWKSLLENQPELSNILHQEGKEALQMFGYEPPRRFADLPASFDHGSVCDKVDCSAWEDSLQSEEEEEDKESTSNVQTLKVKTINGRTRITPP